MGVAEPDAAKRDEADVDTKTDLPLRTVTPTDGSLPSSSDDLPFRDEDEVNAALTAIHRPEGKTKMQLHECNNP
jgi:hypothetical protein